MPGQLVAAGAGQIAIVQELRIIIVTDLAMMPTTASASLDGWCLSGSTVGIRAACSTNSGSKIVFPRTNCSAA
jgi:hypothetical protein